MIIDATTSVDIICVGYLNPGNRNICKNRLN